MIVLGPIMRSLSVLGGNCGSSAWAVRQIDVQSFRSQRAEVATLLHME